MKKETKKLTKDEMIKEQSFNGLQVKRFKDSNSIEILSISLEKNTVFPEHTSHTDAQLIVLEGSVILHIEGVEYTLERQESIRFPKEEKHWVKAIENSKFLIIRPS